VLMRSPTVVTVDALKGDREGDIDIIHASLTQRWTCS
jgi:hypothetical protein